MVIVDVGNIARLFFPFYLLFCSGFTSHLIPFHLYRCSPHLYLWRDLQFGNVIIIHEHIPTPYLAPCIFVWGFFANAIYLSFTISLLLYQIFIPVTYLPFSVPLSWGYYTSLHPLHSYFSTFPFTCNFHGFGELAPLIFSICFQFFSMCLFVYLFHFIDFSILLCFFPFQL